MEVRLRHIRHPAQVQRLLEALVARAGLGPADSHRIRDSKALSAELQALVARAGQEGRVWTCWANALESAVFTCELSLIRTRQQGAPVLLVRHYGGTGELRDSGAWTPDPGGSWRRCAG
jgi:hypothetical protein